MWLRNMQQGIQSEKIGSCDRKNNKAKKLSAIMLLVKLMIAPSYQHQRWEMCNIYYRFLLRAFFIYQSVTFRYLQALCELKEPKRISITRCICIAVLMTKVFLTSVCAYGHEAEGMYAKLLSLQMSENISASGLRGNGDRYHKLSIPWHSDCLLETENVCAGILTRGSYMDVKSDMGERDLFHWEAYGLSVGGEGTVKLSDNISLRGGISLGYSRIYNRSHTLEDYWYPALIWKHKNVLFVSPEIEGMITVGDFCLRSGISFLSASEQSSGARDIGSWAGSYFMRATYTFRNSFSLAGRSGNIIVGNNIGGFYGAGYRDDLGFSLVNETQILADIPFTWGDRLMYIRTGPGLLLADNGAKGMSFTFSLKI